MSEVWQTIAKLDKTAVQKNAKGHNYTYADLEEVTTSLTKLLDGTGLHYVQTPSTNHDEYGFVVTVTTRVFDSKGESVFTEMSMPLDPGSRNLAHALGSAVTYLRRYSLVTIFGLLPSDDDGQMVSAQGSGGGYNKTQAATTGNTLDDIL